MNYMRNSFLLLFFGVICCGCADKEQNSASQESHIANSKESVKTKQPMADLIVHNAKIVTVDKDFSIAEAVAIKDGKFLLVGSEKRVLQSTGTSTRMVDLGGRTILPGFNDTHSHLVKMGINLPATVDLSKVTSITDIQKVIAQRVEKLDKGEWIFSEGGWWEFMLDDNRLPNRHDLDEVSLQNPVALRGGHYFIVNSLAMEHAGYTKSSEDPPGGEIWRDEDGEPTGFLLRAAREPVLKFFPKLSRKEQLDGIRQAIRRVNSWGITSLREAGGSKEQVEMLRTLYENGEMTVRVDWAYDIDPNTPEVEIDAVLEALGSPGQQWGYGMFRADGLAELFLDGAEESGQIRGEYKGRPGYHGLRLVEQDQLNRLELAAARHGWSPGPHAVGDASIDQALKAFEYVNSQISITDKRWMIDHAILLQQDHYERVKKLGLIVNAQPRHIYIIGDKFKEFWGQQLANKTYQLRDWIDNGVMFSLGADRPVSFRSSPLMQIYIAVTRQTGGGDILGPEQGISREEAIRAITLNSAYTSFEENHKGSIEVGKYADFVVLSDDILSVTTEDIKNIEVRATVLAGEVVYGSFIRY